MKMDEWLQGFCWGSFVMGIVMIGTFAFWQT